MATNLKDNNLKDAMNKGNPNAIGDQFRVLKFGSMLRALPTYLRRKAPVADGGSLATLQALVLPDDAKAGVIFSAYARAATAGAGVLAVQAPGTTPATGQIAIAPNGDIVTLAADAITDLDVVYMPDKYDVLDQIIGLPVAANVLAIPAQFLTASSPKLGAIMILEVVATKGGAVGKKIVLAPGAGAPAAGQARLNIAKTTITFAGADAVTEATFKLALVPETDVDDLLKATSPFI